MRVALLQQIPEDPNFGDQWNELVLRGKAPQIFYTYEWALAVQRAYAHRLHPLIFLGYDDTETLQAAVALAEEKTRVSFLCATTGDYCDFIGSEAHRREFVSAVLRQLRKDGCDGVTLTNIPADSSTMSALLEMSPKSGYHVHERTAYECAQVWVEALRIWAGENRRALPGTKKLRRSTNTLARENKPVTFEHLRHWNLVEHSLTGFIQAHVARFVVTGRISNVARAERQVFLRELARLLCPKGSLTLSRMTAGDKVLAWNYGFAFEGTWFWYQPTFDGDFEKYSPGFCLLAKIVEDAGRMPEIRTVDLGLGEEEYKDVFANRSYRTLYVTLRRSLGQHASEILRYRAALIVKRLPLLEGWIRLVAARLRRDGIGGTLMKVLVRAGRAMYSETEVIFCEATRGDVVVSDSTNLVSVDINRIADAVSQYVDDESTCSYLMRCAQRLRDRNAEAFASLDRHGNFLHFAWITDFGGFYLSELNARVEAPSSDCVLIFDCWTPPLRRGLGHYSDAISALTELMTKRGKRVWIFSSASNASSIRGLEKAGFQHRFSIIARRILGWQNTKRVEPPACARLSQEVSAGI